MTLTQTDCDIAHRTTRTEHFINPMAWHIDAILILIATLNENRD